MSDLISRQAKIDRNPSSFSHDHENDLISRQDAIDAVRKAYENDEMFDGYEYRLWELPSAQPEIIRCRECKYAEVADKEDTQDGYICQFHRGSIWFSGSYCSWAERRTDE